MSRCDGSQDALFPAQPPAALSSREQVDDALLRLSGPLVRLHPGAAALLRRCFFLYFLNPGQDLSQFLLVDIGVLKYPRCDPFAPNSATRSSCASTALPLLHVRPPELGVHER